MRILFTNHHLAALGGTELFIREITREWQRRGHEVAVLTLVTGPVADSLQESGVPVCTSAETIPFVPDLIHGQHHVPAMMALCAFPETPALYHCHGYAPWQEDPPGHPRIVCYLGIAEQMRAWLEAKNSVPAERVHILPNAIDTSRYGDVRVAPEVPRRALLFGNHLNHENPAVQAASSACAQLGIEVECMGAGFGTFREFPEQRLPDFDVVFATGRSALEAMACGCAVMPLDAERCHGMVTMENFEKARRFNFTPPTSCPPASVESISTQIGAYDGKEVTAVARHVRESCTFSRYCDDLETLHQSLIAAGASPLPPDAQAEEAALRRYVMDQVAALARHAHQLEANDMFHYDHLMHARARLEKEKAKHQKLKARLDTLKARLKHERHKIATVERVLSRGFFPRRWLRQIKRGWNASAPPARRKEDDRPG